MSKVQVDAEKNDDLMRQLFSWLTPAIVVSFVSGGLAGNIFNWFINREEPLWIAAVINTSSAGADVTTNALVPKLTLKIEDREIPAIHTHVINLSRDSGYADSVEIGIDFNGYVNIFGQSVSGPSRIHNIECNPITFGLKCKLGPMDGRGNYKIALATDFKDAPKLDVAGRNVFIATPEEIFRLRNSLSNPWHIVRLSAVILAGIGGLVTLLWIERRWSGRKPTIAELETHLADVQATLERRKREDKNQSP